MNSILRKITAHDVVVRALPGRVNSAAADKPLHKLESCSAPAWTRQFDELPKCILELEFDNGVIGLGECYRDHDPSVISAIAGSLLGSSLGALHRRQLPVAHCREYDGFECAVWDAAAKTSGLPLVNLLGGRAQERVRVGAWSGHRTKDDLPELIQEFAEMGYETVKFKCDLDDDVVGWCEVIARAAPRMQVILDPNERWATRPEAMRRMRALANVGNVLCIEDPLPRWNLDDYAVLRQNSGLAVALHVSLPYFSQGQKVSDAVLALRRGAVDGFNFNGSITQFQQLALLADAAGMPCWHGSEIDLGILEALYLHKAMAAPNCIWPSDVFGRLIRCHDLLVDPLPIHPPYADLPSDGPGLGVRIDRAALAEFSIATHVFESP